MLKKQKNKKTFFETRRCRSQHFSFRPHTCSHILLSYKNKYARYGRFPSSIKKNHNEFFFHLRHIDKNNIKLSFEINLFGFVVTISRLAAHKLLEEL